LLFVIAEEKDIRSQTKQRRERSPSGWWVPSKSELPASNITEK